MQVAVKAWLALLLCLPVNVAASQGLVRYNFSRPLQVCTASTNNNGLQCKDAVDPASGPTAPDGDVQDRDLECGAEDFCGHDIEVFRYETPM